MMGREEVLMKKPPKIMKKVTMMLAIALAMLNVGTRALIALHIASPVRDMQVIASKKKPNLEAEAWNPTNLHKDKTKTDGKLLEDN